MAEPAAAGDRRGARPIAARRIRSGSLIGLVAATLALPLRAGDAGACPTLDLPVIRLEPPPGQYRDFCAREPDACELSGTPVLHWTSDLAALLAEVNLAVNRGVRFSPDQDCLGLEEFWSFPESGIGDCEDYALEKRRRLVAAGVPSAALTIAILHHREQYFPHAALLVETDAGTWMLDNLRRAPVCWDAAPYRFERRERPDGQLERFRRGDR